MKIVQRSFVFFFITFFSTATKASSPDEKLIEAVINNKTEDVRQILEEMQASPNAINKKKRTVLSIATELDSTEICKILLTKGAKSSPDDRYHPFNYFKSHKVLLLLIEHGIKIPDRLRTKILSDKTLTFEEVSAIFKSIGSEKSKTISLRDYYQFYKELTYLSMEQRTDLFTGHLHITGKSLESDFYSVLKAGLDVRISFFELLTLLDSDHKKIESLSKNEIVSLKLLSLPREAILFLNDTLIKILSPFNEPDKVIFFLKNTQDTRDQSDTDLIFNTIRDWSPGKLESIYRELRKNRATGRQFQSDYIQSLEHSVNTTEDFNQIFGRYQTIFSSDTSKYLEKFVLWFRNLSPTFDDLQSIHSEHIAVLSYSKEFLTMQMQMILSSLPDLADQLSTLSRYFQNQDGRTIFWELATREESRHLIQSLDMETRVEMVSQLKLLWFRPSSPALADAIYKNFFFDQERVDINQWILKEKNCLIWAKTLYESLLTEQLQQKKFYTPDGLYAAINTMKSYGAESVAVQAAKQFLNENHWIIAKIANNFQDYQRLIRIWEWLKGTYKDNFYQQIEFLQNQHSVKGMQKKLTAISHPQAESILEKIDGRYKRRTKKTSGSFFCCGKESTQVIDSIAEKKPGRHKVVPDNLQTCSICLEESRNHNFSDHPNHSGQGCCQSCTAEHIAESLKTDSLPVKCPFSDCFQTLNPGEFDGYGQNLSEPLKCKWKLKEIQQGCLKPWTSFKGQWKPCKGPDCPEIHLIPHESCGFLNLSNRPVKNPHVKCFICGFSGCLECGYSHPKSRYCIQEEALILMEKGAQKGGTYRPCYYCGLMAEKISGCNSMICPDPACKAQWHWVHGTHQAARKASGQRSGQVHDDIDNSVKSKKNYQLPEGVEVHFQIGKAAKIISNHLYR